MHSLNTVQLHLSLTAIHHPAVCSRFPSLWCGTSKTRRTLPPPYDYSFPVPTCLSTNPCLLKSIFYPPSFPLTLCLSLETRVYSRPDILWHTGQDIKNSNHSIRNTSLLCVAGVVGGWWMIRVCRLVLDGRDMIFVRMKRMLSAVVTLWLILGR